MKHRPLGRTGIHVSPYCLGTMMFGHIGNPDHDECIRMVHRALDAGVNAIDTADVYAGGESEEIVGKALRSTGVRRDDVVLATKFSGPMGDDPNRRGASRRWITTALEESLRRRQTDHVDVYQLHHPDPTTDMDETLSALTDLLHAGKIRAFGSSSLPAAEIVAARWTAERHGLSPLRTEQPTYSILNRGIEREVLPVCRDHGMGTFVWSPLSMGLLTGRYRRDRATEASPARMHWVPRHMTDPRKLDAVEALIPVADEAGLSLTHLAMAFAVTHPDVSTAIIGPRTPTQLDDLLAGASHVLDDGTLDRIDAVVPPGTDLGPLDVSYQPASITDPARRRRPLPGRGAA